MKFIRYLYEFCCSSLQPFHLTFGQAAASLLRPIRTTRKYGPYIYGCISDNRTYGPLRVVRIGLAVRHCST